VFAPPIGVDEDIANANNSGWMATLISATTSAPADITVDQGDHVQAPSTAVAHAHHLPRHRDSAAGSSHHPGPRRARDRLPTRQSSTGHGTKQAASAEQPQLRMVGRA
jgi:hypothetical protein